MYSTSNLLVFLNSMFTPFFNERSMCFLKKYHKRITIYIIVIIISLCGQVSTCLNYMTECTMTDIMLVN